MLSPGCWRLAACYLLLDCWLLCCWLLAAPAAGCCNNVGPGRENTMALKDGWARKKWPKTAQRVVWNCSINKASPRMLSPGCWRLAACYLLLDCWLLCSGCSCRWLLQKRRSRTGKHHGTEGRMSQEKVTKNCLTCRLTLLYKQG